jgi:hypothetical protein
MLPFLRGRLNSSPQQAVLRKVGEAMLSELIRELRVQEYVILEEGWMPPIWS